jgi:hypothetical protein
LLVALAVLLAAGPAAADGRWIDARPIANWNKPGTALPHPARNTLDAEERRRCGLTATTSSAEERMVTTAGWTLMRDVDFGDRAGSGAGWRIVWAATGADGMCRPLGYQGFLFVDGKFAGTVSPRPMDSRTDGSLGRITPVGTDQLDLEFARYAGADALCCPSRSSTVRYAIRRDGAGPVLAPVSATTKRTN